MLKQKSLIFKLVLITGWKYFYCILPIDVLDSDDEEDGNMGLQPRYLILDKMFKMFRHFQDFPVLQPSIGRYNKNKILLFDGQHKIASLLWTARKDFECKIYLGLTVADLDRLNKANTKAHAELTQTPFYSAIMIEKLGRQFGKEFENYKNMNPDEAKTEAGFIEYLLNMIFEQRLNAWDARSGENDTTQLQLTRMFSSKSIQAWAEIVRDAIRGTLKLQDEEERAKIFYRNINEEKFADISEIVSRLVNHAIWKMQKKSDIDTVIAGSKYDVKTWFKKQGLTTGYLMGAPE